jgi:glutamine amidotransferase
MAHVRRATIGKLSLENTHPFEHGRWMLIHNGNINAFQSIRPLMMDAMSPSLRESVRGDTDSEHVFKYMMSLHEQRTQDPILDILRRGIKQVIDWSQETEPGSEVALNIIMSNGEETFGSCLDRSLW